MIKYSQNQTGSAHIVIIVVVVMVIIGCLSFIVWNKLLEPKNEKRNDTKSVVTPQEPKKEEKNKIFENDKLTFEYPNSGWYLADTQEPADVALLKTDNYKPSMGMGLDSGASIGIYLTFQQEVPMEFGVKDVEQIIVDGNKGFKYSLAYEGYRLTAIFTVMVDAETGEEENYAVSMQTVNEATDAEKEAFDLVLKSINIK
jgi:hypothetical protein